MPNYKITVEYDGRAFSGWQRQAGDQGQTIQGALEAALSRIFNQPVTVHGSGRTDAGVHARAQVASFKAECLRKPEQIVNGANCLLPPELALLSAETVPDEFHARFSAIGKIYEYDFDLSPTRRPLRQGRAWRVGPGLNWAEVEAALPCLAGEHDFASFQSQGSEVKSTIRTIYRAELSSPLPDLKRLTFEGSGFLRHMVRAMAGVLAEIGRGRIKAASLTEIIAAGDRASAGPTAPPDGLYLAEVIYER